MEDFGDNLEGTEVDPAAEFLAREQNQLAGLEDVVKPENNIVTPIGSMDNEISSINFETANNIIHQEQNGHIASDMPSTSPTPVKQPPREEPEKIKKWREHQKTMLEEKDRNEELKKEEWRETAKKELEDWYKHQEDLIAKTRAANRNAEKQFVADAGAIEPGTEWERIAKLCDFNPKSSRTSKDVSRMRSIILQLKQSPLNAKQA